eukprot:4951918-Pleurochrysis_carterae.AAC.1
MPEKRKRRAAQYRVYIWYSAGNYIPVCHRNFRRARSLNPDYTQVARSTKCRIFVGGICDVPLIKLVFQGCKGCVLAARLERQETFK